MHELTVDGVPMTWPEMRRRVLLRAALRCEYCVGAWDPSGVAHFTRLVVDHLIPKKFGPPHRVDSYVAACRDCNAVKSDWDPRTVTTDHSRDGLLLAARSHVMTRRAALRTRQLFEYESLLTHLAKEAP